MKDPTKKFHPMGSLSRRVILTCLVLLVIPLFIHSIYLYRIEYEQKLSDIELTLQVIGEAEEALIQERIQLQWNRLDAVDSESNPIIPKLGVQAIKPPPGASTHFVLAENGCGGLVVGKVISKEKAFVIVTPFSDLLNEMAGIQKAHFQVSIALVGKDGKILAGEIRPDSLSVHLPVNNSDFFLHLTAPTEAIASLHFQEYLYRFLTLLFLIGMVGGTLVALLIRRIGKPLRKLCHAMDRVTEGAIHIRYEPDRMGFEINELGKQFNATLDALLMNQKMAEQERIGREKLAQELKIGREIQNSLLPKRLPEWNELDISPGFQPALEVSGDFYDLFPIGDEKLLIVVADTEGKGIPACLYALGFRSLLRSAVYVKPELSEILLEANHLFWLDAKHSGTFITAWTAIYDRKENLLTYCSMGHHPAILKRRNELRELATKGIAFGATECEAIATAEIKLQKDDFIFICTDGILEAHNLKSERFGQRRLNEFLMNTNLSSEKTVQSLFLAVEKFSQGAPQHDDMTCLAIRFLK